MKNLRRRTLALPPLVIDHSCKLIFDLFQSSWDEIERLPDVPPPPPRSPAITEDETQEWSDEEDWTPDPKPAVPVDAPLPPVPAMATESTSFIESKVSLLTNILLRLFYPLFSDDEEVVRWCKGDEEGAHGLQTYDLYLSKFYLFESIINIAFWSVN